MTGDAWTGRTFNWRRATVLSAIVVWVFAAGAITDNVCSADQMCDASGPFAEPGEDHPGKEFAMFMLIVLAPVSLAIIAAAVVAIVRGPVRLAGVALWDWLTLAAEEPDETPADLAEPSQSDKMRVCCVCGRPGVIIESTGGGMDYAFCKSDLELFRLADDEEAWPVGHPEGTWAGTADHWRAEGFRVATQAEVDTWQWLLRMRLEAHHGAWRVACRRLPFRSSACADGPVKIVDAVRLPGGGHVYKADSGKRYRLDSGRLREVPA